MSDRGKTTHHRRRGRIGRKTLLFLLLLAGVGTWGARHVQQRLGELPELRTVSLEQRDLRITIRATGTVEPDEVIEVGAGVQGKIVAFGADSQSVGRSVDVGSRITQGTVLVQLERELYEVELQKAQAAWRLAEAEVGRMETQLKHCTRDLERARRLRDTNSQSEFEKIESLYETSVAEMAIGRARLEQAVAAVKQAEINLQRTTICAPIDGVVIDRRANLGQQVGAGASGLFLLAKNLEALRIRTSVNETDIGKISVGQPVTFTVDSHRDRQLSGRVERILLNAKLQGNFVTYDVLVAIDGSAAALLPHMTADVEFETAKSDQAWLVPSSSLEWRPERELIDPAFANIDPPTDSSEPLAHPKQGDEAVVWVPSADGRVQPLTVRVGIDDGVSTEIVGDGFRDGMPIVVGVVKKTALARIIPSVKTFR
ncbi:MAG: efflux RND transporter periplasmic adaptor subunit [Planctomycetales bacterium]|nr:efflux RND transporter periplasmic adaptor subunit [Planctomycetales bacterium]MBN8627834.1 efflux RND transporter periplasmic adaptor subunit [Planctomycetota bacterium]